MSLPWEPSQPLVHEIPSIAVDLRRCTGCHACSVACKVEHAVPLGEFRIRVRWMEDPSDGTMAFLPLFSAATCDLGVDRSEVGMLPACVAACPTAALIFGDAADEGGPIAALTAIGRPLRQPGDASTEVIYRGLSDWQEERINAGVALHPDDADPIYEQGKRR
ncbi:MAG: Fe-S-cluster-containing dehydrogenase component [Myxococcota bacterium]|jgi:Fe-S-cluster-containing dehydrogenase component